MSKLGPIGPDAVHLVIEALTDLGAGSGGRFGARHPVLEIQ